MSKLMWMVAAAAIIGGTTAVYAQKADAPAQKPDGTKIYIMPDDVRCYVLKKDQTTYCTDLQGAPITGELRKYRDNELIRTYQLKDGFLEGNAMSYYIKGGVMSEKPYTRGKLNGAVKNYYENGTVSEVIPYIDGSQEGVTKYYYDNGYMQGQGIYVNGKQNGMSRIYDRNGELVFELNFNDGVLVSGYCMIKDTPDGKPRKQELSDTAIELLNRGELVVEPEILSDRCAFEQANGTKNDLTAPTNKNTPSNRGHNRSGNRGAGAGRGAQNVQNNIINFFGGSNPFVPENGSYSSWTSSFTETHVSSSSYRTQSGDEIPPEILENLLAVLEKMIADAAKSGNNNGGSYSHSSVSSVTYRTGEQQDINQADMEEIFGKMRSKFANMPQTNDNSAAHSYSSNHSSNGGVKMSSQEMKEISDEFKQMLPELVDAFATDDSGRKLNTKEQQQALQELQKLDWEGMLKEISATPMH